MKRPLSFPRLAVMAFVWLFASTVVTAQPTTRKLDHVGERGVGLEATRSVVYKKVGDRELRLYIFEPDGFKKGDKRPCFHLIHGGGWQGMTPQRMFPVASDFAKRYGMVGVSVEYRLYRPDGSVSVFDCVKDVRSSVRFVRAHAAELGIDPDRIVVSGGSAGGHLAAATALFDKVNEEGEDTSVSCMPDALVLLFPVIDTSAEGYGQKKIGDRWQELSPVDHVRSGLPPTITFHGTGDTTTPFKGAKEFHEKMLAAGNQSVLDINEGGAHGYLMRTEPLYEDTIKTAAEFLDSLGMLKP